MTVVPVIMVGGAGTRLWPLSRRLRPKQFHALASERTLLQATAARVAGAEGDLRFAAPIVVAGEAHASLVREQLAPELIGRLVLEPMGRNTGPCAVIAAELAGSVDPSSLLLLLPSDHFVADVAGFRRAIAEAAPAAEEGRLVTFGVVPTRPETGYGYILAEGEGRLHPVQRFVEKPDAEQAARYQADGRYFWNAGIFLIRADRLLEEMGRFRPDLLEGARRAVQGGAEVDGALRLDPDALSACPAESLDYAVMERTQDAVVLPIDVGWSDIGDFDALWETGFKDAAGNAARGEVVLLETSNSFIQTDGPLVAALGVSDLVVIVQNGAVLIAPRRRAQDVKLIVERLRAEGRADKL